MAYNVVVEASSLINPLAEAWRRAFEAVGAESTGALIGSEEAASSPAWLPVDEIGTAPHCIVSWWGLAAEEHSVLAERFPSARHVVIVDTYPNASRPLTEVREWLRAKRRGSRADLYICYSNEMVKMLDQRRLVGPAKALPLLQPFDITMHRDSTSPDILSIIFTGRSDLLFSATQKMAKDALGPLLCAYQSRGFEITVADPGNVNRDVLIEKGFRLYPRMTNSEVLDGCLASEIAAHSFQLCTYAVTNSTIGRRVNNGLSSRFALGVTANTPVIVSPAAGSSARFVRENKIGLVDDDPMAVARAASQLDQMRANWRDRHAAWSTQGQSAMLRHIMGLR